LSNERSEHTPAPTAGAGLKPSGEAILNAIKKIAPLVMTYVAERVKGIIP